MTLKCLVFVTLSIPKTKLQKVVLNYKIIGQIKLKIEEVNTLQYICFSV